MEDSIRTVVEFLVEPFTEGAPGTHVKAAIVAVESHGLEVEVGPFGSVVTGPLDTVTAAMADMTRAAMEAGAGGVTVRYLGSEVEESGGDPVGLHDALSRIVWSIEAEFGGPLEDLAREDKQAAVRLLDESGAFLLKRSIEDVAARMGVSRITIYNYLNAIRGDQ